MKISLAVILALFLVGCQTPRRVVCNCNDLDIQNKLVGTWVCHWENSDVCSTTIILPGGDYYTEIDGFKYHRPAIFLSGQLEAKNGELIDTIKYHSRAKVNAPLNIRGHIKQMSDNLLVVKWDGIEKDSEYKKVE
jgi:hypothetical protein